MSKRSNLPPMPRLRPRQRYAHRTWKTEYMMEVLAIYYRCERKVYPLTWQYRVLIMCHREQHSSSVYRKGYGPDWKNLKWQQVNGQYRWAPDAKAGGISLKEEVIEYARHGRLPLEALKLSATEIRKLELELWVKSKVAEHVREKGTLPLAAE